MNLFAEIEGLRGENLSSALLRFVFLRSQDARTQLADLLTGLTGTSFSAMHRFACILEGSTDDANHGSGRIDLLVEMDDALVGIENKFNAGFQQGQPEKYLHSLCQRAEKLSDGGFISKKRHLLVILAPKDRHGEIQKKIDELPADQKDLCRFLSWEEMLAAFREVAPTQDSKTREVISYFDGYVNRYLRQSFFHQKHNWLQSLEQWMPYGSERQRQVVSELCDFFPNVGGRLSYGETWVGYYFGNKGWFGFTVKSAIATTCRPIEQQRQAELLIVVGFDISSTPAQDIFHLISMKNKGFGGAPERSAWAVDYEKLKTREEWVAALAPFTTPNAATT